MKGGIWGFWEDSESYQMENAVFLKKYSASFNFQLESWESLCHLLAVCLKDSWSYFSNLISVKLFWAQFVKDACNLKCSEFLKILMRDDLDEALPRYYVFVCFYGIRSPISEPTFLSGYRYWHLIPSAEVFDTSNPISNPKSA